MGGWHVRELRRRAGLSQADAAARCGWPLARWRRFEEDLGKATLAQARTIARALACDVTDLLPEGG